MIPVDETNALETARRVKAGELPGPAKSLAEALARIYADGGRYVHKSGTMQGPARYSYAKEGDFIAALRPLMEAHGVTVSPKAMQVLANESFERKNGGTAYRVAVLVTFRLLHSSGDALDVQTIGEGQDSGDKAFNKAMTAAMKYALRQTFCVETGDDPDDTPSHEQERAAPKQQAAKPAEARPSDADLVSRLEKRLAGCPSRVAYEEIVREIKEAYEARRITEDGRAYLLKPANDCAARFPKQATAAAK